jgi:hypothetical protein
MRLIISLSLFSLLAAIGLGCERKNTANNDQKGNDPPISTAAASSESAEEAMKALAGDWEVASIENPPPFLQRRTPT